MPIWPGHPTFEVVSYRTPRGSRVQGDNHWGGANDACLVQKAGVGIAFEPKSDALARVARIRCAGDLRQLLSAAAAT